MSLNITEILEPLYGQQIDYSQSFTTTGYWCVGHCSTSNAQAFKWSSDNLAGDWNCFRPRMGLFSTVDRNKVVCIDFWHVVRDQARLSTKWSEEELRVWQQVSSLLTQNKFESWHPDFDRMIQKIWRERMVDHERNGL